MNDKQHRKLMRLFGITWFLLLILILVLLFTLFREPDKQINNYAGAPGPQGDSAYQIAVKNGFMGTELEWLQTLKGNDPIVKDGRDGQNGVNGKDGKNAISDSMTVEKQTIIERTVPEKGDRGNDGRTPQLDYNEETGDVEVWYEGDTFRSVLIPACALKEKGCKVE